MAEISLNKTGNVTASNYIEDMTNGAAGAFFKQVNNNLLTGIVDIVTNKNGTISSTITKGSISGATIKALAGQTLCMSYETSVIGDRYSTEQGQTAWNQTRYGIHGGITIDSTTQYPFAGQLNYSGGKIKHSQLWTIPTGNTSYGDLTFSVQNFDKPASTNNATWYIKNLKVELANKQTPYTSSEYNAEGNAVTYEEIMEV